MQVTDSVSAAYARRTSVGSGTAQNQTSSASNGRSDLLASLRSALPGLSIKVGTLPDDQAEQEKLFQAGKLAAVTIDPKAADRMQTDDGFQQQVVAGVKADQEANRAGTTTTFGGTTIETLAHGTVVEADGTINGWTFSKSTTTVGNDDDKTDKKTAAGKTSDKKTFLQRLMEKLKQEREEGTLDADKYDCIVKQVDGLTQSGRSDDDILAAVQAGHFDSDRNADAVNPSPVVAVTA